jgi:hypothetical protein
MAEDAPRSRPTNPAGAPSPSCATTPSLQTARHHRNGQKTRARRPAATTRRSATCTPASWTSKAGIAGHQAAGRRTATHPRAEGQEGFRLLVAHLSQIGVTTPYGVSVRQDARNRPSYAVYIGQSGLGSAGPRLLPEEKMTKMADAQGQVRAHVANILTLAGDKDPAAKAKAIVALRNRAGEAQWTKVEPRPGQALQQDERSTAVRTGARLRLEGHALAAAGIANKVDYVIVNQPSYLSGFNAVLDKTDLATWKAYFEWQVLRALLALPVEGLRRRHFDFYGTVLTGVAGKPPRWKRGVAPSKARWAKPWASCTWRSTSRRAQGAHGRAGQERAGSKQRSIDNARLDEPGNQEGSASQAGQVHAEDRLPEQVARLLEAGDQEGGPGRQRDARRTLRLQPQHQQAGQADRPRRVGHDAADHQRLLQLDDERDRVPGRDPAAAVLRRRPTTRSTTAPSAP